MSRAFLPNVTETAVGIRVAWDMRYTPRSRAHLLLIGLATPFMAAVGLGPVLWAFGAPFWGMPDAAGWVQALAVGWCAIFWLFAAFALYDLFGLRWAEWVEVSDRAITYGRRGFLAPAPSYSSGCATRPPSRAMPPSSYRGWRVWRSSAATPLGAGGPAPMSAGGSRGPARSGCSTPWRPSSPPIASP